MIRRGTGPSYTGFLERRRARQRRGDAGRSYTFELAALHLELLVAMAAVDEQVRSIEVEEVLAFVDRTSLGQEDLDRLAQLARGAIDRPPKLDALGGMLSSFARKPALARALVEDLARVAAADARAEPREVELLDFVCDALELPRAQIVVPDEPSSTVVGGTPPTAPRGPRIVTQRRTRAAVRQALEASYESHERPI